MFLINSIVENFTRRISPQRFARIALILSAFWFLALYPVTHWFFWDHLPRTARMSGEDFTQYYMGALASRHDLWAHLYPITNEDRYSQPPSFKPLISTPLFDQDASASRQGNWIFYPQVAKQGWGSVSPELLKHCPKLKKEWMFVLPPPCALLLTPLGYTDFRVASNGIWFPLLSASFFGIGYLSSRICRMLWQRASYAEGWTLLFPIIPTILISGNATAISYGNISPFLGFLVSLVAFAWLTNRQFSIGFGIVLLVLFKGIGLTLGPLLLLRPRKWMAIGMIAFLALLLNGGTLYFGGIDVYRTFFLDILPKAYIPIGGSPQAVALQYLGLDISKVCMGLHIVGLLCLYWGYCYRNREQVPHSPSREIAMIAGVVSLSCLFNKVLWLHYYTNYIMLPFAGWILWEGLQATGMWRKVVFAMLIGSLLFWSDPLIVSEESFFISQLKSWGMYGESVRLVRNILMTAVFKALPAVEFGFIFLLAFRRLLAKPSGGIEMERSEPVALVG